MFAPAIPPPPPPAVEPPVVDGPRLPQASEERAEAPALPRAQFRLPERKGTGMFGAAAGLFVLGAVGNAAAWQLYLDDCHPREGERGDCLGGAVRFLGVTYGATTLTRGSWALAALGGDWLGEYRGARDGWLERPPRPTRGLMAAGGVAFAVGVVVQAAGLMTFLRSDDCTNPDANAERTCMEPKVWSYVSMLTVGSGLYTVGSGLLGYGGAYKEAHGFWSRRRLNVAPSFSARNLGGALSLRF